MCVTTQGGWFKAEILEWKTMLDGNIAMKTDSTCVVSCICFDKYALSQGYYINMNVMPCGGRIITLNHD